MKYLLLVVPFIICWSIGAFTSLEMNMLNWQEDSRTMFSLFSLIGVAIVVCVLTDKGENR